MVTGGNKQCALIHKPDNNACSKLLNLVFNWVSLHCTAEQPLRGSEFTRNRRRVEKIKKVD